MRNKTRKMILTGLFTALTAAGAFVRIPIGPAPVTLQLFFTLLAGILLGPYRGALSQALYVALGLAGIPVFASGGGLSYVLNPAFGYLFGFCIAPLVVGWVARIPGKPTFLRILSGCALGSLAIYAVGVPYMYMILNAVMHTQITLLKTLQVGFVVFLPGDIAKSVLAACLGKRLIPIVRKSAA